MNDDYGSDYLSISDEEGNEFELEHLDTMDIDDQIYMAFLPADMDEDDEDFGIIILKVVVEDGEELLNSIDDEDELNRIFDKFVERHKEELE